MLILINSCCLSIGSETEIFLNEEFLSELQEEYSPPPVGGGIFGIR